MGRALTLVWSYFWREAEEGDELRVTSVQMERSSAGNAEEKITVS
jgi:hypothetical protein